MHHSRHEKYSRMTLPYLKRLRDDIQATINQLESAPVRPEADIGAEYTGAPELIATLVHTTKGKKDGRWRQLQTIYCSKERCARCPHGPYWYSYSENRQKKTVVVKYKGMLYFSLEALRTQEDNVRPGITGELIRADSA
jgi:hypothetical protein